MVNFKKLVDSNIDGNKTNQKLVNNNTNQGPIEILKTSEKGEKEQRQRENFKKRKAEKGRNWTRKRERIFAANVVVKIS